jgi:hypothetical protein
MIGESSENNNGGDSTTMEIAALLLSRFRGRADYVAVADLKGFHPHALRSPMQPAWMRRHLGGQQCLGFYLLTPESRVFCTCVDFDNKPEHPDPEWANKAGTVYTWLDKAGLSPVAEISASGTGGHIWVFFDVATDAWLVRAFWRFVEKQTGAVFKEVYPRQDELSAKGLGNLVRYPLWNMSRFADPENEWATVAPAEALSRPSTSAEELKVLAASLGTTLKPGPKVMASDAGGGLPEGELPPRVSDLLKRKGSLLERRWNGDTKGLKDDSRSALVMSITCELVRQYIPTHEIEAALGYWCTTNNYDKGERDDWVALTVGRAYDYVRERSGVRLAPGTTQGEDADGDAADITIGPFVFRPGPARRTPASGVKVQTKVLKDGLVVYDFVLSASPTGWREHAAVLQQLAGDAPLEVAGVLAIFARIVADGGNRADAAAAAAEGGYGTIETIVKSLAGPRWQLTPRMGKGAAWSESRGGEVSRAEFTQCVDDEMVMACARAAEAPRRADGAVARPDLLRLIQAELQIAWATILRELPPLADVNAGINSAAARAFREAMVRLWTNAVTWEVPRKDDGRADEQVGATRASLVSRVRSQRRQEETNGGGSRHREKWRQIHPAAAAWWRMGAVGEVLPILGMRWEIVATLKQELPGVADQESLLHLGRLSGVFLEKPPVPDRLSGGKSRLAVLTPEFTEELMSFPVEDEATREENTDNGQQSDSSDTVTGH